MFFYFILVTAVNGPSFYRATTVGEAAKHFANGGKVQLIGPIHVVKGTA